MALNTLRKVLIANRGEIACRVIKSAQRLGMETVAIYSEADARAKHVRMADAAMQVGHGSAASTSYLDVDSVLAAAKATGAAAARRRKTDRRDAAAAARSRGDAAGETWPVDGSRRRRGRRAEPRRRRG